MARIWSVFLALLPLGIAVCLMAVDNAHNARLPSSQYVLERAQHLIDDSWGGHYEVKLDSGAIDDEFVGTAKGLDGTTLRLIIRIKDGDVVRIAGLHSGGIGALVKQQPRSYFDLHPRLMLYTYAVAFSFGVFGLVYPLLGVLKFRKLQSPAMERWLRICTLVHCGLIALMAYAIVTQIRNGPERNNGVRSFFRMPTSEKMI